MPKLSVDLDRKPHNDFKRATEEEGSNMSDVVRHFVDDWLLEHDKLNGMSLPFLVIGLGEELAMKANAKAIVEGANLGDLVREFLGDWVNKKFDGP